MNREQASWLAYLTFHWGEAYRITYAEDDRMWRASWRGREEPLVAKVPEALRELIREDHAARGRERKRINETFAGLVERMST